MGCNTSRVCYYFSGRLDTYCVARILTYTLCSAYPCYLYIVQRVSLIPIHCVARILDTYTLYSAYPYLYIGLSLIPIHCAARSLYPAPQVVRLSDRQLCLIRLQAIYDDKRRRRNSRNKLRSFSCDFFLFLFYFIRPPVHGITLEKQ